MFPGLTHSHAVSFSEAARGAPRFPPLPVLVCCVILHHWCEGLVCCYSFLPPSFPLLESQPPGRQQLLWSSPSTPPLTLCEGVWMCVYVCVCRRLERRFFCEPSIFFLPHYQSLIFFLWLPWKIKMCSLMSCMVIGCQRAAAGWFNTGTNSPV